MHYMYHSLNEVLQINQGSDPTIPRPTFFVCSYMCGNTEGDLGVEGIGTGLWHWTCNPLSEKQNMKNLNMLHLFCNPKVPVHFKNPGSTACNVILFICYLFFQNATHLGLGATHQRVKKDKEIATVNINDASKTLRMQLFQIWFGS